MEIASHLVKLWAQKFVLLWTLDADKLCSLVNNPKMSEIKKVILCRVMVDAELKALTYLNIDDQCKNDKNQND
jgi:hypothetical protein